MAEQSMFWPTTGTGDGISGGYTSDRLSSIWKAVIGDGVLKYQNDLEVTGVGSTSLAINTGAAVVDGYLYENTSSATITTSTLSSATYGLYIIANESASALTVNRSVAGTSVATKTVRLALNSTTPSQPYVKIANVTTVAGTITVITDNASRWATSRSKSAENYLNPTTPFSFTALTSTDTIVVPLFEPANDYLDYDSTTGVFTVKQDGTYIIQATIQWDTNTTNRRRITIAGQQTQFLASSVIHTTNQFMTATNVAPLVAGETFTVSVWQDSGATRTIEHAEITAVRL